MVDSPDWRGVSILPMDRLSLAYIRKALMATGTVGKRHFLGNHPGFVVVRRRHFQALPMASGIGRALADFMGSPIAKTGKCMIKSSSYFCSVRRSECPNSKNIFT